MIDADASAVSLAADKVVRVDDPDPWLFHLKFQAGHDLDILPRMAAYQGVLHDRHRLPVASVLLLWRRGPTAHGSPASTPPPHRWGRRPCCGILRCGCGRCRPAPS